MFSGCGDSTPNRPATQAEPVVDVQPANPVKTVTASPKDVSTIQFLDVTGDSGVTFRWSGGPTSQHCMVEQNGGGVALFDFDKDGLVDILLTDCGVFDNSGPQAVPATRLFRNDGDCRFSDASPYAGMLDPASAMGVAAGDFNSDGFTDLFVACYGNNLLYINHGDGTFSDVAEQSGIEGDRWSTSAAFADLDGDGLLDLYVTNYVDWRADSPPCRNAGHPELLQICSPARFNAQPDALYRNLGDTRFRNVGVESGIALPNEGKGLALDIADFSEDGRLDVFVANDTTRNSLFLNRDGLKFEDSAVSMGVAVSSDGTHGASMGTASGDFNQDGYIDLFVTNFRNQVNDLFSGIGEAGFTPAGSSAGISLLSNGRLAFGAVLRDFDLDGWPDLFIANGHIWDLKSVEPQVDYQMPPDILRNIGGRSFVNAGVTAGSYFEKKWLGRAVAAGDIDGDGMVDLVIQHVGDPAVILKNASSAKSRTIMLSIIGTSHCRNPLGCRVTVSSDENKTASWIPAGGSFQASHDARVAAVVPDSGKIDLVEIVWPDASQSVWRNLDVGQSHEVVLIENCAGCFSLPD